MVFNSTMLLENLVRAFILQIKVALETYINNISKPEKYLIKCIKLAQYLHFLANLEQKIVKKTTLKRRNFMQKNGKSPKFFA